LICRSSGSAEQIVCLCIKRLEWKNTNIFIKHREKTLFISRE